VCAFCAEWGGWLNVEIKSNAIQYPGIEQAVLNLIRAYGLEQRVFVSSFNHYSLQRLHTLAPELPTAILYSEMLYRPWEYASRFGTRGLHPHFRTVTAEMVAEAQLAGAAVRPWTVDEVTDLTAMVAAGVDAIITNRVDRALAVIGT
jgi:glycerophosphoryl diester phosphodiesterase